MGGTASSFFSSDSCRKLSQRRLLLWLGIFLAVLIGVSTLMGHFLMWRIESKLDIKVERKPIIFFIPGIVSLRNATINYGSRFQVYAKKISAIYSPIGFVLLRIPVHLSGHGVSIRLSPEIQGLDKSFSSGEIPIDKASGDLIVNLFGKVEIKALDVDSKVIQFHLGPQSKVKKVISRDEKN